jgi:hypothetical protein
MMWFFLMQREIGEQVNEHNPYILIMDSFSNSAVILFGSLWKLFWNPLDLYLTLIHAHRQEADDVSG